MILMFLDLGAVYVLVKREVLKYWRSKSRIASSLATPLFFFFIMGGGLSKSVALPGGAGNYLAFVAPGVMAMTVMFASAFGGVSAIVAKQFGFLKEILVAPVSRTSIVAGKVIGGATTAVLQGLLLMAVIAITGTPLSITPISLLFTTLILFLVSAIFLSGGLIIATRMDDVHGFQLIMNFFIMPAFLLSGTFFSVDNLPSWLKPFTLADPLTYGVDGLRAVLVGHSSFPLFTDLAVLSVACLISVMAAAYAFNKMQ